MAAKNPVMYKYVTKGRKTFVALSHKTWTNVFQKPPKPRTLIAQGTVTGYVHGTLAANGFLTHSDVALTSLKYDTRAVCEVRGLTLLLRVGTSWRCGDGLFFEVPPLASDELFTTLHPLLENVLQTVDHFEISCLGAPFSWSDKSEITWDEI
jgi:hypothetical protein